MEQQSNVREEPRQGEAPKLLLVEDDVIVARLATRGLARIGYDVVHVETGRDAIARLTSETEHFAVALIDLGLPDMEGTQVVTWLRRHEREHGAKAHTTLIISSAQKEAMSAEQQALLGVDAILPKPLSVAAFAAVMDRMKKLEARPEGESPERLRQNDDAPASPSGAP